MGWFELRSASKGRSPASSTLEDMVKPYREAIVGTTTPPAAPRVEVRSWEDLTRASDTLGKPILRYTPDGARAGHTFYVLDGPTSYVFEYGPAPSNRGAMPTSEVRLSEGPPPPPIEPLRSPPSPAPVPTTFTRVNLEPSAKRSTEADPDELPALRDRARGLLRRVTAMPASDPALNGALATLGQAIVAMRGGRLVEARSRLDAVEQMIRAK